MESVVLPLPLYRASTVFPSAFSRIGSLMSSAVYADVWTRIIIIYVVDDVILLSTGLPEDRPLFRPANALDLYQQRLADRLRNPHTTLPPSGCVDGQEFLTKGRYDYYHYMQDSFDDNGWGCAYRSFQTIVSWFVLQGYKQIAVPGHVAIQELCVKNEMRKKDFIGSKYV